MIGSKFNFIISAAIFASTVYFLWIKIKKNTKFFKKTDSEKCLDNIDQECENHDIQMNDTNVNQIESDKEIVTIPETFEEIIEGENVFNTVRQNSFKNYSNVDYDSTDSSDNDDMSSSLNVKDSIITSSSIDKSMEDMLCNKVKVIDINSNTHDSFINNNLEKEIVIEDVTKLENSANTNCIENVLNSDVSSDKVMENDNNDNVDIAICVNIKESEVIEESIKEQETSISENKEFNDILENDDIKVNGESLIAIQDGDVEEQIEYCNNIELTNEEMINEDQHEETFNESNNRIEIGVEEISINEDINGQSSLENQNDPILDCRGEDSDFLTKNGDISCELEDGEIIDESLDENEMKIAMEETEESINNKMEIDEIIERSINEIEGEIFDESFVGNNGDINLMEREKEEGEIVDESFVGNDGNIDSMERENEEGEIVDESFVGNDGNIDSMERENEEGEIVDESFVGNNVDINTSEDIIESIQNEKEEGEIVDESFVDEEIKVALEETNESMNNLIEADQAKSEILIDEIEGGEIIEQSLIDKHECSLEHVEENENIIDEINTLSLDEKQDKEIIIDSIENEKEEVEVVDESFIENSEDISKSGNIIDSIEGGEKVAEESIENIIEEYTRDESVIEKQEIKALESMEESGNDQDEKMEESIDNVMGGNDLNDTEMSKQLINEESNDGIVAEQKEMESDISINVVENDEDMIVEEISDMIVDLEEYKVEMSEESVVSEEAGVNDETNHMESVIDDMIETDHVECDQTSGRDSIDEQVAKDVIIDKQDELINDINEYMDNNNIDIKCIDGDIDNAEINKSNDDVIKNQLESVSIKESVDVDSSSDISQTSDYINDSSLESLMVTGGNFMEYIEDCLNGNKCETSTDMMESNNKLENNWPNDEDSLNNIKRDFYDDDVSINICSPHPSSESDHAHCVNNLTERVAILSAESILDNHVHIHSSDSERTPILSSPSFDDCNPELYVEKITYGDKELDVVYFDESVLEEGGVQADVKIVRTIPVGLGGRIIGKKGKTKNELMKKFGAQLLIYNHPEEIGKQVLQITCNPSVKDQLEKWVNKTLEQITKNNLQTTVSNPEWLKPMIPLGRLVAAHIVDMSTIQHIKLRIYDPDIIRSFNEMQKEMNIDYGNGDNTAVLPRPVAIGCVCVAMIRPDYFLRAQIIEIYDDMAWVYLFDIGKVCQTYLFYLFKIREKYMRVPFQVIPARLSHALIKNKTITPAIIYKRFLCDQKSMKPKMVRVFFPRMNTCCEPCANIYIPMSSVSDSNNSSEEFVDLLELLVSMDVCSMVRETVNSDIQVKINTNHFKAFLNEKQKKQAANITVPLYFQPCNSKFYEDFIDFKMENETT